VYIVCRLLVAGTEPTYTQLVLSQILGMGGGIMGVGLGHQFLVCLCSVVATSC
jgi:hypothetical protein